MEEYSEPLEADLLQYYGLDLVDLFRPGSRLTWRRLRVLVRQLPPTARTAAAQAGHDVWPGERHLLADLVDLGQVQAWLLAHLAADRRFRQPPLPAPTFVHRPQAGVDNRPASQAELLAFFGDPTLPGLAVGPTIEGEVVDRD